MQEKGIPERRTAFLETCFDTFCENGLENTSLKMLVGLPMGAYFIILKVRIIL